MDYFRQPGNREGGLGPPPPPFRIRRYRPRRISAYTRWLAIVVALVVIFIVASILKSLYTDWLWFEAVGFRPVFAKMLTTRVWLFFAGAGVFLAFFVGNYLAVRRLAPLAGEPLFLDVDPVALRRLSLVAMLALSLFLAVIFGSVASGQWDTLLKYLNSQPFGREDPTFHRDVGFYMFELPFLRFLQGWSLAVVILTTVFVAGLYLFHFSRRGFAVTVPAGIRAHLSLLVVAILGIFIWGYWLSRYDLNFSSRGVVFGAAYTDVHAQLPAIYVSMGLAFVAALAVAANIFRRGLVLPVAAVILWVAGAVLVGLVYPATVQRFEVEPNELEKESEYIERNIAATNEAYGLINIDLQEFDARDAVTVEELAANPETLNNIRLWDHRPLRETLSQIQSIRPLYDFLDVDVDRYTLDGQYRQTMLSARELSPERLPSEAQTWVNRRLQYTHGYGVALSAVNEVVEEGLPRLFVKDIPPEGTPEVTRPQIYYGEMPDHYVIVNSKEDEFDYTTEATTALTTFEGEGGVKLDSFWRRLFYAWEFGDANIMISGQISSDSQLLYRRNIQQRVSEIAPFLRLDHDPYLVIADGRLFWIQDAYTVSDRYPYSQPSGHGFNYIRNSVKVTIDAYDGSTTFYLWDESDPIARVYDKIFPDLFTPREEMPASLQEHVRYPEDLFQTQVQMYTVYHMDNARALYNKEDVWKIPEETFFDRTQPMEPYYVIMRLPGEERAEFIQIMPFSPANKKNAVAWLAARSDFPDYGKLIAFRFPSGRFFDGPEQIEFRIDQNTTISEQFTLWNQAGSQVIRGNLLMIPIGQSALFVEPIYLQAQNGGLPELKRVIVVNGNEIAMEPTLEDALDVILGRAAPTEPEPVEPEPGVTPTPPSEATPPPEPTPTPTPAALPEDAAALAREAQEAYQRAREALQRGDFATFGAELDRVQSALDRLVGLTSE